MLRVHPTPSVKERPSLLTAVQFERLRSPSQWEPWRLSLSGVFVDSAQFGTQPRLLRDDGNSASFLFPGLPVSLHVDEAEGYFLNLSSGTPVWFVMWRSDESDPPMPQPEFVTLSYHEAGRLLDAQERVDNLPLPPEVREWLQAFADEHYRPEPKKRRRPESFRDPSERG